MKLMFSLALIFLAGTVTGTLVADDDFTATEAKIKAAMGHERRTEKETNRDRNRLPVETLKFFQLRDDMSVLELLPGGGWYTKILAPVLEEKGKLYISIGAENFATS
ncbi:MAG TPA: hypothetical protein QF517_04345, partial [Pseudomonadales bacterium]|nr:hypothetical protein [Pseudomonadales bacterium]